MRRASPGLQWRATIWMARSCQEAVPPAGDDAAAWVGEDEVRLRPEIDVGVTCAEQVPVRPVRGRGAAFQESGLGKHDGAGTG